ncbi:MAG: DUF1836 domain-containing protein [Spirochaetaceae bacterium]|nr:DUF1836 domain-containing protein [Spirochaetaceae bacterium]
MAADTNETLKATIGKYAGAMTFKLPAPWDQLPDIGLYMDQVITYLERQLGAFRDPGEEHPITSSMINNYAKAKLIPRTDGKKYTQEHIARLLSVFSLKRVLSVQDIGALFDGLDDEESLRAFYELFRAGMEDSAKHTADTINDDLLAGTDALSEDGFLPDGSDATEVDRRNVRKLALNLAIDASIQSYAAEMLLSLLAARKKYPDRERDKDKDKERMDKSSRDVEKPGRNGS